MMYMRDWKECLKEYALLFDGNLRLRS